MNKGQSIYIFGILVLILVITFYFDLIPQKDDKFENNQPLNQIATDNRKSYKSSTKKISGGKPNVVDVSKNNEGVIKKEEITSKNKKLIEDLNLTKVYLKEKNHQQLLSVLTSAKNHAQLKSSPEVDEVKSWINYLYKDAIQWRLLEQKLSENEVKILANEFKKSFPELNIQTISHSSPHLRADYLRALQSLIKDYLNIDTNVNNSSLISNLSGRCLDLISRRKKLSDTYFKTEIKNLFQNQNISLANKIAKTRTFYDNNDESLVRYSMGYFNSLIERGLSSKDEKIVKEFLDEISR